MPRSKRLSKSEQYGRRASRWSSAVFVVATVGFVFGALGIWGGGSSFALETPDQPIAGWLSFSWLLFWVYGALMLWSGAVFVLAGSYRDGDRHAWVWGWGGLAIVAAISLSAAYAASRNGVALYEDRIVWRQSIFAPLETTRDAEVSTLNVTCEMVRPPAACVPTI